MNGKNHISIGQLNVILEYPKTAAHKLLPYCRILGPTMRVFPVASGSSIKWSLRYHRSSLGNLHAQAYGPERCRHHQYNYVAPSYDNSCRYSHADDAAPHLSSSLNMICPAITAAENVLDAVILWYRGSRQVSYDVKKLSAVSEQ